MVEMRGEGKGERYGKIQTSNKSMQDKLVMEFTAQIIK